jgi:DinB superfamily
VIQNPDPGPDPVTEADAYRRSLLDALGPDDPADAQAETPQALRALVAEADGHLRTRPAEGEWSVIECVGHIVDGEIVSSGRYRWILVEDEPDLLGYDQDLWVNGLHHADDDPEELLSVFEALRAANIALWSRLSASDRARVGLHRERGPESVDLTFRLIAGHDRVHLAQARRTLDAVRAAVASTQGGGTDG